MLFSMKDRIFLSILLILWSYLLVSAQHGGDYPSKSLQCYSYLTKPDMKLICPAARYSTTSFSLFKTVVTCNDHGTNDLEIRIA